MVHPLTLVELVDAQNYVMSGMHECRYHYRVRQQYRTHAVIAYFCVCSHQWILDVLRIEELAVEEAAVILVVG